MSKPSSKYPWVEIRQKYETGKYSIPDLADEYGFNTQIGYQHKRKEEWVRGIYEDYIDRAAAKKVWRKTAPEAVDKEAYLRARYDEFMDRISAATIEELFEKVTDFERLKQLKISTQILTNTRQQQWEINMFEKAAEKMDVDFTGDVEHGGEVNVEHKGEAAEAIIQAIEANRDREGDDQEGSE